MSDEDRVIRVARALCVADGNDPETPIEIGADDVEEGTGWGHRLPTAAPNWVSYVGEARRMIAAVRAMGLVG